MAVLFVDTRNIPKPGYFSRADRLPRFASCFLSAAVPGGASIVKVEAAGGGAVDFLMRCPQIRRMSERIEINPRVCGGQLVIKGTRIPVATILEQLADDESWDSLLRGYPELTRGDIQAALEYACPSSAT